MTLWRYTAVAMGPGEAGGPQRGELAGASAVEVRASLRRVGLQVVELRPIRERARREGAGATLWGELVAGLRASWHRHRRARTRHDRAELYDALATMLASGIQLAEALTTLTTSKTARGASQRRMLLELREALRGGRSLDEAMSDHPGWFDAAEIAMVRAGQHGGNLSQVLESLARRHQRSGELNQKLVNALAYPTIIAIVGLGVVVFLSVRTLPNLTRVLVESGVEVPALTARVMGFGQLLARYWPVVLVVAVLVPVVVSLVRTLLARRDDGRSRWLRRATPRVMRRMAVSNVALQLAELIRTGVPAVESLRVLAPTAPAALRHRLTRAATRVEGGEDLATALADDLWFDAEFQRLVEVGEMSGELDDLLERLGERYARQAARLIDRLAAVLEPAVILGLAALVGVVVMAAVLPLLRLQEIL